MLRAQKQEILDSIKEMIKETPNIVVADYRGLTVQQITDLRNKLREKEMNFHVTKNTLLRIAFAETGISSEELTAMLAGPTGLVWCSDDPVTPAKIITDFGKQVPNLKLKGAIVDGKILNSDGAVALSNMPTKEQALSKILGGINAPATNLAGCCKALHRELAGLFAAYKEKLEEAA